MTVVGNSLPLYAITETVQKPVKDTTAADAARGSMGPVDKPENGQGTPEGVKVSLSEEGKYKAVAGSNSGPDSDIEESGLPGRTQAAIKNIRGLQEKLAQLRAELEKIRNDKDLDPETAQLKIANLTAAMSGLNAAMAKANKVLNEAMDGDALDPGQIVQARKLAEPPKEG